ncbi:MAG: glycoside hydrolase family 5 protein [Planctomycetota bacterium]|nr:glycoside hydrolase family 5 protein [Planctomycetota bacterium]
MTRQPFDPKTPCAALLLAACASLAAGEEPAFRRGVNAAGPEFGGALPGKVHKDYTFNNEATFKYFAEKGLDLFRVPLKWERLQTELGGELDAEYLQHLKQNVAWAKAHGGQVLLDLHNYGRRRVKLGEAWKSVVIDVEVEGEVRVTRAHFVDIWLKLSKEFKDEPAVWGYGLMNEPHDMGTSDWKAISNAAVKALRDSGDLKTILVAGLHWSNSADWGKHNGPKSWIDDPSGRFLYEAHCYFDSDRSGSYKKSYEEELKRDPDLARVGVRRLKDFADWCKENKVGGFLGEFGVPRDDPRWYTEVLKNFMRGLDEAGMGGTYWAAGIFWGDNYKLSVHPAEKFTQDRPQLAVLLEHLAPRQGTGDRGQ